MLRLSNSRARALTWFLVWFIILSHQIGVLVCQDEDKPSMFQLLSNILSSLKKPHQSYWEKTKSVVHEFQLHFTPPRLDFRGTGSGPGAGDGSGEKVKAAVKDMIGTSEAVAEESAKSAAEAVHKTAEKLKGSASVPRKQESSDEL